MLTVKSVFHLTCLQCFITTLWNYGVVVHDFIFGVLSPATRLDALGGIGRNQDDQMHARTYPVETGLNDLPLNEDF